MASLYGAHLQVQATEDDQRSTAEVAPSNSHFSAGAAAGLTMTTALDEEKRRLRAAAKVWEVPGGPCGLAWLGAARRGSLLQWVDLINGENYRENYGENYGEN